MDTENKITRHNMFSTFIKSINYEMKTETLKFIKDSQYIERLFSIFGINDITESTSKNWLSDIQEKNQGFIKCFLNITITDACLQNCFVFFRDNIKANLYIVQNNLSNHNVLLNKVNLETNDTNDFIYSLIDQFLYIVKPSMTLAESTLLETFINKTTCDSHSPDKSILQIFCAAINESNLAFYIDDLKSFLDSSYDYIENMNPFSHRQYIDTLFIPSLIETNDEKKVFKINNYKFSSDMHHFLEDIKSNILVKFVTYQDETSYILIKKFYDVLESYVAIYSLLSPSIAREFSQIYIQYDKTDYLFEKCQFEIDKTQKEIAKLEQNKDVEISEDQKVSLYTLQNRETQLGFLLSLLSSREQICSLFEELTNGKSLLTFSNH